MMKTLGMGSGKLLASGARKNWFILVFSIRVCCVAVVFNDYDGLFNKTFLKKGFAKAKSI